MPQLMPQYLTIINTTNPSLDTINKSDNIFGEDVIIVFHLQNGTRVEVNKIKVYRVHFKKNFFEDRNRGTN